MSQQITKLSKVSLVFIAANAEQAQKELTKTLSSYAFRSVFLLALPNDLPGLSESARKLTDEETFSAYPLSDPSDWYEEITPPLLGLAHSPDDLVFFLSSKISLRRNALETLLNTMKARPNLLGVNPLMVRSEQNLAETVSFLGFAVDSQGQLHNLYEGLNKSHELVQKRRRFQFGHFNSLLMHLEDFTEQKGFQGSLSRLAPFDFCLRLRAAHPDRFFTVDPKAEALQTDNLDALNTCGLWNSLRLRGRLQGDMSPDYHLFANEDNLVYGINEWLSEEPIFPVHDIPRSRYYISKHDPLAFCQYLGSLTGDTPSFVKVLSRLTEVSYYLPHTFSFYDALAKRLLAFSKQEGLVGLETQVRNWNTLKKSFKNTILPKTLQAFVDARIYTLGFDTVPESYAAWVELEEPRLLAREISEYTRLEVGMVHPLVSIIMPVWNPNPAFLREAIMSVRNQSYPHWDLCIADDFSSGERTRTLLQSYARDDTRIRIVFREQNGHISLASNSALELSRGSYAGFLDQDDMLAQDALLIVANRLFSRPHLAFLYSDEDSIDANGVRRNPVFRSVFSLDHFIPGHFMVLQMDLIRSIGGFRKGFEGAQDRDLVLRACEQLPREAIEHIPHILYHWRIHPKSSSCSSSAKPYVFEASERVLHESMQRRGLSTTVHRTERNNFFKISLEEELPSFSIILSADKDHPLDHGFFDHLAKLAGRAREILVLCPEEAVSSLKTQLQDLPCLVQFHNEMLTEEESLNACAENAQGEVLFFLSGHLIPLEGCSPKEIVLWAAQAYVGMVGAMLYAGGRLWHGGLFPDLSRNVFPLLQGTPKPLLSQLPLAFTTFMENHLTVGASRLCLAIKKELFLQLGGFDRTLGPYAESALCLELEDMGLENSISVWGQWEVGKSETLSRYAFINLDQDPRTQVFQRRFASKLSSHPLRNPNLQKSPTKDWTCIFSHHEALKI